jgi:hypothetical protein
MFPSVQIVASAGCASATTCIMEVGGVYFHKVVSR